jgi:hypothetical protein
MLKLSGMDDVMPSVTLKSEFLRSSEVAREYFPETKGYLHELTCSQSVVAILGARRQSRQLGLRSSQKMTFRSSQLERHDAITGVNA